MHNRFFGIDLRKSSPPLLDGPQLKKDNTTVTVSEARRPSMDHFHKRPGLPGLGKKHLSDKGSKDRSQSKDKHAKGEPHVQVQPKPVKLNLLMESPPALFIDPPQTSTGALISGRLQVTPNVDNVIMTSIVMYLECTTTTKRPVQDRCRGCMSNETDLYEWNFLSKPKTFNVANGMQELPFSHLIPGHIPATTHGQVGSIDYSLHVRAMSSDGKETEFRRELVITRALRPGNDKNSVRIFPPTNLSLNVTLPSVVHPIGDFPIMCRMTGITTKREETQTRWRLRKLTWRIEEHEKMISPACSQHSGKVGGEGKGVQHQHDRDIGSEDLKSGWKTDFDDGQVEGEFSAAIDSSKLPQCDVEAPNGLKISHNLVLELVIAEEWAPNKKPQQCTPTGAARVLRTQFTLNVSSRSGMGISWDDEMPPVYEDVPASPPQYPVSPPMYQDDHTSVMDYQGDDIHEVLEDFSLNH